MRSIIFSLFFGLFGSVAYAQGAAHPPTPEPIIANVKGMVCDFCARAVSKVFLKEDGVTAVDVDLDKGQILITTTQDAILADAKIDELVNWSGYELVNIERPKAN